MSCNLGTLTSWNPLGHSRPVTGLLYLFLLLQYLVIGVLCYSALLENVLVKYVGSFIREEATVAFINRMCQ